MGKLHISGGKLEHSIIDPLDGRERPFCNTIGKLVAVAFQQNRFCGPTPMRTNSGANMGRLRSIEKPSAVLSCPFVKRRLAETGFYL